MAGLLIDLTERVEGVVVGGNCLEGMRQGYFHMDHYKEHLQDCHLEGDMSGVVGGWVVEGSSLKNLGVLLEKVVDSVACWDLMILQVVGVC